MDLSALINLNSIIPTNGISAANFLKVPINAQPVGTLDSEQVKGLIAQAQASTNQAADAISSKGIGSYGIQPDQLEKAGYLKPGTVANFLKTGGDPTQVLSSPSVWTGKDGVVNKTALLGDPTRQASITQQIMSQSAGSLQKLGVLTSGQSAAQVGALIQSAVKFGPGTISAWTKGLAPANLLPDINNLARQGQFAVSFVDTKLPSFSSGILSNLEASNTVNRTNVDQAVKNLLGSDRYPVPNYTSTEAPVSTPIKSKVSAAELSAAVKAQLAAGENYEKVLKANNGDRTAPAVEAAFAAWKAAIAEADQLGRLLGL